MKRRIVGLLVMLVFMGLMGAMPVMAAEITAPDGYVFTTDTNGVIQIGDAEALTEFSKYVNEAGGNSAANAVLTADIKLNETLNNNPATNWETWGPTTTGLTSWTPIGNQTSLYTGNFDGANHTISGIYLYAPDANEGQGLFGSCFSDIKDLKVTASYFYTHFNSNAYVGGIAGWMDGSITNCQVEANLVGYRCVGGIAGSFSGTISGSSYRGSVTGVEFVGGIVGRNDLSISIISCYNNANVTGNIEVGGIIGHMSDSRVENSANTGAIKGDTEVGGICGIRNTGSIVNCYQAGKVTGGDAFTGGILGRDANASNNTNCYYLSGSAVYGDPAAPTSADGIGDAIPDTMGQTEAKTDAAFATGEVAYRLNNYSAFDQTNWRHWTQSPGEALPSLALDGSNIIDKKITLDFADPAADLVFYGATGSTLVGLPTPPAAVTYSYTKTDPAGSTVYSQAEMASYQFTAVDDLVFTVKAYQLTVNNEGVIEIATPAELTEFAKYVNDGYTGANARLMADIVLNATDDWEQWGPDTTGLTAWSPIGNFTTNYNGTFDGGGHIISGIYINAPESKYLGLFGRCGDSAKITNLKVMASYLNGLSAIGGIAGTLQGSITNC